MQRHLYNWARSTKQCSEVPARQSDTVEVCIEKCFSLTFTGKRDAWMVLICLLSSNIQLPNTSFNRMAKLVFIWRYTRTSLRHSGRCAASWHISATYQKAGAMSAVANPDNKYILVVKKRNLHYDMGSKKKLLFATRQTRKYGTGQPTS